MKTKRRFFSGVFTLVIADLYRLQQRDQDAETTLRESVKGNASVAHALGLLLVREKET